MRRKPRNYRAEYARRIARGLAKGLSRSQARGHPTARETTVTAKTKRTRLRKPIYDPRLEPGLKAMREGRSLSAAAREVGVARERLQRYALGTGVVKKRRGRWVVRKDMRARRMLMYSSGQERTIAVRGTESATLVGRYMAAVRWFLETNDPTHLAPFERQSVIDLAGREVPFETRPNALYRLASTGSETFEQIYRIVM